MTKLIRTGVFALCLAAVAPITATYAQNSTTNSSNTTVRTTEVRQQRDFDWGWLGLLGLAGLLGLMPKKRVVETTVHREQDTVNRPENI